MLRRQYSLLLCDLFADYLFRVVDSQQLKCKLLLNIWHYIWIIFHFIFHLHPNLIDRFFVICEGIPGICHDQGQINVLRHQ